MPENSLFRTFCRFILATVILFNTLNVPLGYAAYSAFSASDYAAPRAGGTANMRSVMWNKVVDNVDDIQTRLLNFSFSSGNVGIGTATPGAKLEVAGQVKITGGTPGAGKALVSDATGLASWSASAPLYAETDPKVGANVANYISKWNGSALVAGIIYDNATNVGIGTATPGYKLDVVGTSNFSQKLTAPYGSVNSTAGYSWTDAAINTTSIEIVNNAATVATSSPTLAFHRYGTGGPQFRLDPAGTNVLYLESANAASARKPNAYGGGANSYFTRFHVDGQLSTSGNVGIGTTTPGAKLEVAGQVKITGGTPGVGKVLTSDATGLASWSASAPVYTEVDPKVGANTTNYVSKWNGSALVAGTVFDNGTNVGIGTATPNEKFDVNGAIQFRGTSAGYATTQSVGMIDFYNAGSRFLSFGANGTTRGIFSWYQAGQNNALGQEAMRIDANGNLGVGTTVPGAKLEVAGQVKITGGTPGAGKVLTSDATGLASWSASAPLYSYTETDPQVGANTANYVPKWDGTALVAGTVFDNGTNVGIGNAAPSHKLDVTGNIRHTGRIINNAGIKTYAVSVGSQGNVNSTYELMRIGRDSANWSWKMPYEITVYNTYYRGSVTKWIVNYNQVDAGSAVATESNGLLPLKLYLGAEVSVSGTIYYRPVLIDLPNYQAMSVEVKYNTADVASITGDGQVQFTGTISVGTGTNYNGSVQLATSGGNVGIGTATPATKLDVQGGVRIGASTDYSASLSIQNNGNGGIRMFGDANGLTNSHLYMANAANNKAASMMMNNADGRFSIFNYSGAWNERLTLTAGGNFGIGTTSPLANLDVAGNIGLGVRSVGTSRYIGKYVETTGAFGGNSGWIGFIGSGSDEYISFGTLHSGVGGGERMRIDRAGNVGIGTTAPWAKLDVKDQINLTNAGNVSLFGLKGTNFGYSSTYRLLQLGNGAVGGDSNIAIGVDLSGNASGAFQGDGRTVYFRNGVSFWTPNSANTGYHYPIILKDGNVGINTGYSSSPAFALDVLGTVNATGLRMPTGAGAGKVLTSDAAGLASWSASAPLYSYTETDPQVGANTANYVPKWDGTALVAGIVYDNATNVGIGTATPGAKLDIAGAGWGSIDTTKGIRFGDSFAGIAPWNFNPGGSSNYRSLTFYTTGWDGASVVTRNVMTVGGYGGGVGINDTAPGASLSVVGNAQIGYTSGQTGPSNGLIVNGNVGIGTVTPGAKLEVAGQIKITGGTPGAGKVLQSDAAGLATWSASAPLYSYTETDPQVGANTTSFVPRWNGTALVAGTVQDNGTNVGIGQAAGTDKFSVTGNSFFTGDVTVTGKLVADKLVNRTVNNVSVSGSLLPDLAAPATYRDIGNSTTQRWNNAYVSGQINSSLATGTAPFAVTSTTVNTNLNADMVDGYHANAWVAANNIVVRDAGGYVNTNYFNSTDDVSAGTITYMMAKFGDNYYRSATAAKVQTFLGLGSMAYQNTASYQAALGYTPINKAGDTGIGALTVTSPFSLSQTNIEMRRDLWTRNGISWYATAYPSWSTYMSPAGAAATGPHGNITAPSGSLVTGWALRDYIENAAGYGWTFESAANTTTPSVVAEIRASDGAARFGGNVSAPTFTSSVAVGTAPFAVTSTTAVANLNADMVDGLHASNLLWYNGWVNSPGYDANTIGWSKSGFSYSNNAPHTGPLVHFDAQGYGLQLSSDYSGGGEGISFRTRNGDLATWNNWKRLVTTSNIGSYSPTLTGVGASGTWNISIAGNADTVDGLHASSFVQTSAVAGTTNYLSKFTGANAVGNSQVFDNGTNVGIGTASPSYKLDVNGTSRLDGNSFTTGQFSVGTSSMPAWLTVKGGGGNGGNIQMQSMTSYAWEISAGNTAGAGGASGFSIRDVNAWQFRFGIDTTGNVGIGTALPSVKLHVQGTGNMFKIEDTNGVAANQYAQMQLTAGSANNYIWTNNQNSAGFYGGSSALNLYTGQASPIAFFTNTLERMRIDSVGNVGIGTTNPLAKLDVSGTVRTSGRFTMSGVGSGDGMFLGNWQLFDNASEAYGTTNAFVLYGNSAPRLMVGTNGNVGIGTISPTEKLDVDGNVKVSGNVTSTAYYYNSDRNLKKNIVGLTGSLEKVTRLNGYSFDWKKDGRKDLGVIAQEVEKVYPELVSTNATTGMKSVEYGNLVAPLIESVKELKRITEEQNAEIRALQEALKTVQSGSNR